MGNSDRQLLPLKLRRARCSSSFLNNSFAIQEDRGWVALEEALDNIPAIALLEEALTTFEAFNKHREWERTKCLFLFIGGVTPPI
ncbi:MAG: hypothetical protein RMX97_28900 [Nostoc sp. DedQUE11]|nr:hypothetical protein [Nostoc sp. DedQUE11]